MASLQTTTKNKGFKSITEVVVWILVLIIIGGGYWYVSRPSTLDLPADKIEVDTTDWQTYTNDEYGFEFMYPNNVHLGQPNNHDVLSIVSFEPGADQVTDLQVAFNIFFEPQTNAYSESLKHWQRCLTYNDIQIGDNSFKYSEDNFGREYCLYSDLKFMKGLVVRVADISKDQKRVEQILSTFRFNESNSNVELQKYPGTDYYYKTYPNLQLLTPEEFLKQNYEIWLGVPSNYLDFVINEPIVFDGMKGRKFGTERDTYYLVAKDDSILLIMLNSSVEP